MSGYTDEIKTLQGEVVTIHNQAKTLHADLDAKVKAGNEVNPDDQQKLLNMIKDGDAKRQRLDVLLKLQEQDDYVNKPAAPARAVEGKGRHQRKTWGQIVTQSETYKQAKTRRAETMDRVEVKALYATDDATGGLLIQTQREPEIIDIPQRPTTLLDLINQSQTDVDAVEFVRMLTRTNNAAPVPEWTGGNFGLKPESNMTFDLDTAPVKTIATWVAASRQILADAPRLRNMIDVDLTQMLRIVLENEVISGDGTGSHFLGMLNAPEILLRTQGSGSRSEGTDSVADTLRRAITDVRLGFYTPTGIALNPTDVEEIELERATDGQYIKVMDVATGQLWRLPVVETSALSANTALVADFAMAATIWDRMQTEIRVGEPNDFFLRNAVAILAELRAAFAVTRPQAICKVTLTA